MNILKDFLKRVRTARPIEGKPTIGGNKFSQSGKTPEEMDIFLLSGEADD